MNKLTSLAVLAGLSLACATTRGGESSGGAPAAAKEAPAASELGTNLALNKPVVSSSDEKLELAARKAVDGSETTRWSSNFFTDANPANAWIYVDLGEKTAVQTVVLNWEAAYGTEFTIMASDDAKDWKVVDEEKDGHSGKMVVKLKEPVATRYVKIQGIKRGTPYGYSLWELEVYGK
jgi:hypothetical protein